MGQPLPWRGVCVNPQLVSGQAETFRKPVASGSEESAVKIGLTAFATYIPDGVQTSEYLAQQTGIPENVLIEKFGIRSKPRAAPDESASEMAVKAAKKVLNGFDPRSLDVVIWTGSEHKDYGIWSAGPKVQHE